jgi:hypothetical protein
MSKNEKERTYSFGKYAVTSDKKVNEITVTLSLQNKKDHFGQPYKVFSTCIHVWNSRKTDAEYGGQCFDIVYELLKDNEVFNFIYDMWKKYYLHDLHAGTKEQEDALKEAVRLGELDSYGASNYKASCEYLKQKGLYEVEIKEFVENSEQTFVYTYGTGWLIEKIPEEDLKKIDYFIENGELLQDNILDNIER